MMPKTVCPACGNEADLEKVLTAQSNQNVIYRCSTCQFERKNIRTSKG